MPATPRITIEEDFIISLSCAICGHPRLRIVHLERLPDYVACEGCQSAFVVELGGERVMYGKIPDDYPETSRFALRDWAWLEAIERRAIHERTPAEPAREPELAEAVEPEGPSERAEGSMAPVSTDLSPVDQIVKAAEEIPTLPLPEKASLETPGLTGQETPEEAEEDPLKALRAAAEATDTPAADVLPLEEMPEYTPPEQEDMLGIAPLPSFKEAPESDFSLPAPAIEPGQPPEEAFGVPATLEDVEDIQGEAFPESPPAPELFGELEEDLLESAPPIEPDVAPEMEADGTVPAFVLDALEGEQAGKPEPQLREVDPPPGQRYRVVLKGTRVRFPGGVCAHCARTPARSKMDVAGSFPNGQSLGKRRAITFTMPLCRECRKLASQMHADEKNARLQAHLVAALIGMVLLVAALAWGLDLRDQPLIGLVIIAILATVGYSLPAMLLLGRVPKYPSPPEAAYIRTTLLVQDEADSLETGFEWRNKGYAERFHASNKESVLGKVTPIKDRTSPAEG